MLRFIKAVLLIICVITSSHALLSVAGCREYFYYEPNYKGDTLTITAYAKPCTKCGGMLERFMAPTLLNSLYFHKDVKTVLVTVILEKTTYIDKYGAERAFPMKKIDDFVLSEESIAEVRKYASFDALMKSTNDGRNLSLMRFKALHGGIPESAMITDKNGYATIAGIIGQWKMLLESEIPKERNMVPKSFSAIDHCLLFSDFACIEYIENNKK